MVEMRTGSACMRVCVWRDWLMWHGKTARRLLESGIVCFRRTNKPSSACLCTAHVWQCLQLVIGDFFCVRRVSWEHGKASSCMLVLTL